VPPAFFKNPLETSRVLRAEPASKTLLPELLKKADLKLSKNDYFQIAQQMRPSEIPAEVVDKLDAIHKIVSSPSGDLIPGSPGENSNASGLPAPPGEEDENNE
jgi:hypothetical protein